MSCSWTALTTCWPGLRLFDSSSPTTRARIPSTRERATPDVDVGLEQRGADLAQRLVDVGVAEPAPAAEAAEDPFESVGQGVEHAEVQAIGRRRPAGPLGDAVTRRARSERAQSNRASTNSSASKGTRSSGPSPIPTSFTGRPSSRWMAMTMPALGRAVELGEHDTGDPDGVEELARLGEPVLARGGVEHEQHLVDVARAADPPRAGSSSVPRPG